MNEELKVLQAIEDSKGLNNKKKILKDAMQTELKIKLYDIFSRVFDRKNNYGAGQTSFLKVFEIKDLEGYTDVGNYVESNYKDEEGIDIENDIIKLSDSLRLYSGNDLLEQMSIHKTLMSALQMKWYFRIVGKDLRLGLNKDTINKIVVEYGFEPIDEFVVQLCEKIEKLENVKGLTLPCICQTKYDGTRIIATFIDGIWTLTSRTDKDCTSQFPEIISALLEFGHVNQFAGCTYELDGEIISSSFSELSKRLGRKEENIVTDNNLKYVLYDIRISNFEDCRKFPYKIRWGLLKALTYTKGIDVAESTFANTLTDVEAFYQAKLLLGEEGIVIKNFNATYASRPSEDRKGQWKYKPVLENTFEITGLEKGNGKNSAIYSKIAFKDKSGEVVSICGNMSDEELGQLNSGNYPKFLDVEYLQVSQNKDGKKSLRHPRFLKWRWDKTEADDLS